MTRWRSHSVKVVMVPMMLLGALVVVLLLLSTRDRSMSGGTPERLAAIMKQDVKGTRVVGGHINPRLTPNRRGGSTTSKGSLAHATIGNSASAAVSVATAAGRLDLQPVDDLGPTKTVLSDHGGVATFRASALDVPADLGVRPIPTGIASYAQLRDPASKDSITWRLALPGDERLQLAASGRVLVVAPVPQTSTQAVDQQTSPNRPAGSLQKEAPRDLGGMPAFGMSPYERIVAEFSPPTAIDASGRAVSAQLTTSGDTVTASTSSNDGPIVLENALTPTGNTGDGWITYGMDAPLSESSYSILEGSPDGAGGCRYSQHVHLTHPGTRQSREVAAMRGGCAQLLEDGPISQALAAGALPGSGDTLEADSMLLAARTRHQSQVSVTSKHQDPPGLVTDSAIEYNKWTWNGTCVKRPVRRWKDHRVYAPTGWHVTGVNQQRPPKECASSFAWVEFDFSGGQYFPACAGVAVNTYQIASSTGLPDGAASIYWDDDISGPPCKNLLTEIHNYTYDLIY